MSAINWIITYDHLENKEIPLPNYKDEIIQAFNKEELVDFRLFDDDGELYYSGKMRKKYLESDYPFGPLDWAMNDSGCTYMEYLEDGAWKIL